MQVKGVGFSENHKENITVQGEHQRDFCYAENLLDFD